jgi:4-hydroxyphenylpyruvate dioxygenase
MTATQPIIAPPRLGGIDHLEWWVGNARAFAGFLAAAFGFEPIAHAGPETGRRDRVSYLLQQGDVRFLVTGGLTPDSPVAEHVRLHGDGIRDIAFIVDDVDAAYEAALARGATSFRPPVDDVDETGNGTIRHAAIATYGETVHTFLDRSRYDGPFAPQFEPSPLKAPAGAVVGIERIDHVVANVELGTLGEWVDYYEKVLGFDQLVHFSDDAISTEYSALMSTVVWNHDRIVLPINEPASGRRKSQIEPSTYYDEARERMGEMGAELPWERLAELGILVDRDHDGFLLQIFTETLTDRPTVFFEVIQREGAKGFGEGNFKALFQAIEREQERRGNL